MPFHCRRARIIFPLDQSLPRGGSGWHTGPFSIARVSVLYRFLHVLYSNTHLILRLERASHNVYSQESPPSERNLET